MAYQQNQQGHFEFDLARTNDSTYDDQSLAYQETNSHVQSLQSPASVPRMLSHGEGPSQYRKDSFANSAGVLSPASSVPNWEAKFASHSNSDHVDAMSHQQFRFNNPFAQHDSSQYYSHGGYLMDHNDSSTATVYDGLSQKYEPSPFPDHANMHPLQSPPTFTPIQQEPNFRGAVQIQTPMSPHSHEEWEAMGRLEKEGLAFPTHIRMSSPSKHVEKRRGDGVRKKNAKIDIPDGRTVPVIEELMAAEQDELTLKELKGQKRLLRNREAALASRQRKKKHTEDLEVKLAEMSKLYQDALADRGHYIQSYEAEKTQRRFLEQRLHEADVTMTGMHQEKEHMIADHTKLTITLRQKISLLEESLSSPAPAMSAAPSSAGYTDLNSDMDHFNIGGDWDRHIKMFPPPDQGWEVIADSESTIQPSKLLSNSLQPEHVKSNDSDQHIPTGVLFMLLLCGAFVAANSTSKAPVIPRMPEEVREASNTVLSNLLQDMKGDTSVLPKQYNLDFNSGLSSQSATWPSYMPDTSSVANMHAQLTSPTRRQLLEQASMLTPEQYNSLTQPTQYPERQTNLPVRPNRRNLAEILGNIRQDSISKGTKADVYTRSLLLDQVPEHVIEQFKQAVQDSKNEAANTAPSTANDYNTLS